MYLFHRLNVGITLRNTKIIVGIAGEKFPVDLQLKKDFKTIDGHYAS